MQMLDPYMTFLVATYYKPERWFVLIPVILYCWVALYPLFAALYHDTGYGKPLLSSAALFIAPVGLIFILRSLDMRESHSKPALFGILVAVTAALGLFFLLRVIYGRQQRLLRLWCGSAVAGVAAAIYHVASIDHATRAMYRGAHDGGTFAHIFPRFMSVSLLFLFLAVYVGILYQKAFEGELTDAERDRGRTSLRAWLSPGRLTLCLIIALLASVGYDAPFLVVLAFCLLGLVAHPLAKTFETSDAPSSEDQGAPETPNATERARILKLLEDGRITAQECQELLQALSESAPLSPPAGAAVVNQSQRLRWLAAGLMVLGFFLPWFAVDLGREMQRAAGEINQAMSSAVQSMPGGEHFSQINQFQSEPLKGMASRMGTVTVGAADLKFGMGFIILLLGVGALVLPWAFPELQSTTLQRVSFLALIVGCLLTAYYIVSNLRYVHVGSVMTFAGYLIALIGVSREFGLKFPIAAGPPRVAQTEN